MAINIPKHTSPDQPQKYQSEVVAGQNYSDHHGYGSAILLNGIETTPILIPSTLFKLDPATGRPHIELFVTSEKELKWRPALQFVVNQMKVHWSEFSEDDVTLKTLKVDSGIAEQPIGREAGELGARNRCKDARIEEAMKAAMKNGETCMVISFENTISIEPLDRSMPTNWMERYGPDYLDASNCIPVDVAAIYLQVVAGSSRFECTAFSDGVTLPLKYLKEAESQTTDPDSQHGYDITCGKLISRDTGLPDANWHAGFTGYSRDLFLNDGIERMPIRII